MASPDQLVQFVTAYLQTNPQVLGAKLGFAITRAFPEVNLKAQYGGLRPFLERYCSQHVTWTGKRGLDDCYAPASASPESTPRPARDDTNLWQAFTNPEAAVGIAVNPTAGTVVVADPKELAPGFLVLAKMTREDHRKIASEFLPQIDSENRAQFQSSLSSGSFWPQWTSLIASTQLGRYRGQWLAFRFQRICDILRERLNQIGIQEPRTTFFLDLIKDSKRKTSISSTPSRIGKPLSQSQDHAEAISILRHLAHAAIDGMPEEELRQLRIPLGAIIDSFRELRSK